MTDQTPPTESIPYEVLTAKLESALLEQVRRGVLLEARIAVRDQIIADKDGQIERLSQALARTVPGNGVAPFEQPAEHHVHD